MKSYIKIMSRVLVLVFLITAVFSQYTFIFAKQGGNTSIERNKLEVIIKYKNANKADSIINTAKTKMGLSKLTRKKRFKNPSYDILEIGSNDDIKKTVSELSKNPNIAFAQINYKLSLYDTTQDEQYENQWGLLNNGQTINWQQGTSGVDINIENAWALGTGVSSTVIGVLDTGIDNNHNDLKDTIYINPGDIPGNGVDDDGNGYIDDINGWDFANGDNTIYDSSTDDKHGTHVAGIIAAEENNGGIKGVAPGVKILPLKFIKGNVGYTSDAIEAIEYAKALGVKIINCSFGGPDNNPALKDAIQASGILFVCAAGNGGTNSTQSPVFPACYNLTNIISVAAMNNQGSLANFSNYGSSVDVAAPGVDILSTIPENRYEMMSGTSMAAPFVTGIAALLQSNYPDMTVEEIAGRIKANVKHSEKLVGKVTSNGYTNALDAVTGETSTEDTDENSDINDQQNQNDGVLTTQTANVSQKLQEEIHYGEKGINFATGNFSKSYNDISIAAPGFQVNISRTYNSKDSRTANLTMGKGWFFGFEGKLTDDNSGTPQLKIAKLPNGSSQVFIKNADGTYTPNDSRSILVKDPNDAAKHILTTKDQYSYGFNSSGYLTWMKDKNGNAINIDVDASNGKVTRITDTVGRVYSVAYNGSGCIASVTDPLGRKICYEYYPTTNYLKYVYIKNPSDVIEGTKYEYSYDSQGFLSEEKVTDTTNSNTRTTLVLVYSHATGTDQDKVTQYTDDLNNMFSFTYATDSIGKKTVMTDTTGRQYIKWSDDYCYLIKSQDPDGMATTISYYLESGTNRNAYGEENIITDRAGNRTTYERNSANGNITKITYPDGSTEEFSYDTKNNLIMEKDRSKNCTYYIYDTQMVNLLKKAQPVNGTDVYTIDADQSKFAVTSYNYYTSLEAQGMGCNVKGLLKATIDPEGHITKYTYDSYGYQKTVTDPMNNTVTKTYNSVGWLLSSLSAGNYKTDYAYDNDGRVTKTTLAGGEITRTIYDGEGRKIKEALPGRYRASDDGLASTTPNFTYEYDSKTGRLNKITENVSSPFQSAVNYVTSYTYDIYGNVETETKPNNSRYYYEYDAMNRLKKISFKDVADSTTEQLTILEENTYTILSDGKSKKTNTRYLNNTEKAVTTYTYDYDNRLVEQLNADGSSSSSRYYGNGTVASTTNGNGATTYFKYDGLNRLTEKWAPLEPGRYMYTAYHYDKAGNLLDEKQGKDPVELNGVPASDRFMVKAYTYYADNRKKSEVDGAGGRTEYQYDSDGNMIRQDIFTDTNNSNTTEFEYNHLGKPITKKAYIKVGDLYGNLLSATELAELVTNYSYDLNGNLTSITTPDGLKTVNVYDSRNRLLKTAKPGLDENGNAVTLSTLSEYGWDNQIIKATDAKQNITEYSYTPRGLLEKIAHENVTDIDSSTPYNCITMYAYDKAGRKIMEAMPVNYTGSDITTNVDIKTLNRTVYTYDSMDRVKTKSEVYTYNSRNYNYVSKAYKYDAKGNVIKELDGMGYDSGVGSTVDAKINSGYGTEYTYNQANMVSTVLDPVGKDRGLSFTTMNKYDGAGRKASEQNGNGAVTCYYYDDSNRLVTTSVKKSATTAEQVVKSQTYDLAGNLLSQKDGNGNTTTFEYNSFGKVRKIITPCDDSIPANTITFQYDVMGNLLWKQDKNGTTSLYSYDPQGHELTSTEQTSDGSDSITTAKAYDRNGNVTKEIDGRGTSTIYCYDQLNRLIKTSVVVKTLDNRAVEHSTKVVYDKNGNKKSEKDWLHNSWTYDYDPINRLVKKFDPENPTRQIQTLEYNYSNVQTKSSDFLAYSTGTYVSGHDTLFEYDKDNRLIKTTDPRLHTIQQDYDNAGNISVKIDGRENETNYTYDQFNRLSCVTDANSVNTTYTYDLNGNLLTQTDGNGHVTIYEYNVANKPVCKIDNGGRTGSAGKYTYNIAKVEKYSYDAAGNMLTRTDKNGVTTTYVYDVHKRLLSQNAGTEKISYTYDDNGNQLSMKDSTGTTTRTYDELNRVLVKSVPNIGSTVFTYDIIDTSKGVDAGYVGESSKDPKGNSTLKINDKDGRLKKVSTDGGTSFTNYSYDGNGNRTQITYPSGIKEVYEYYTDNLLQKLYNRKADNSAIEQEYTYDYDAAHNQTSKTDLNGSVSYIYDSLNRLQKVIEDYTGPNLDKTTEYVYDKGGNRLSETVTKSTVKSITNYIYNEQNRLISTVLQNGGTKETTKYTYDNNGNMTSKSLEKTRQVEDPSNPPTAHFGMFISGQATNGATEYAQTIAQGTAYYEYNVWNQMVKSTSGTNSVICKYNGDGLRVEKNSNGAITRFLYEYDKVILEVDNNGRQSARNVYGINLISRTVSTDTLYYMYNGHADVTSLTDSTGVKVAWYYYDAFGTPITDLTNENSKSNPFRYAGYQYDGEIGLYYLNSRYYDSKIARFLSEDTYGGDVKDPLSLNLYTYCSNNPIVYIDPTGHWQTAKDNKDGISDGDRSPAAQAQILQASIDYNKARDAGDAAGMAAAHQAAEDARSGKIYFSGTTVTAAQIEQQFNTLYDSKYTSQTIKNDLKNSDLSIISAAVSVAGARPQASAMLNQINTTVKNSNIIDPQDKNLVGTNNIATLSDYYMLWGGMVGQNMAQKGQDLSAFFQRMGNALSSNDPNVINAFNDEMGNFFKNLASGIGNALADPQNAIYNTGENINEWFIDFESANPIQRTQMLADVGAETIWDLPLVVATDGTIRVLKNASKIDKLNVGAGSNAMSGYRNIDIKAFPGVEVMDANNLNSIKTASMSEVLVQNPYGFKPLESDITRVLKPGGNLTLVGGMSNKYFNYIYNMSVEDLKKMGYELVDKGTASDLLKEGCKTISGKDIDPSTLKQIVLRRMK